MLFIRYLTPLLLSALALSCGHQNAIPAPSQPQPPSGNTTWPLNDSQVHALLSQKIFFGHKSVGGNIVQGIHNLVAADTRLQLYMVSSDQPASVPRPAFIDSMIGENGDPASKDQAFAAIVNNGFGGQDGVALYKYCYADITSSSDVQHIFQNYRATLDALKETYPRLKLVPVTVPLTTDASQARHEFNNLLRQTYAGTPIFDLAEVESTHADGSRSYQVINGEIIYTLAAEYSSDGGHLNDIGRQAAAKRLLVTLANL